MRSVQLLLLRKGRIALGSLIKMDKAKALARSKVEIGMKYFGGEKGDDDDGEREVEGDELMGISSEIGKF